MRVNGLATSIIWLPNMGLMKAPQETTNRLMKDISIAQLHTVQLDNNNIRSVKSHDGRSLSPLVYGRSFTL